QAIPGLSTRGGCFARRLTQPLDLPFQRLDTPIARGQCRRNIGSLEPPRNMLRAIGVPGVNGEQDHLLGTRLVALWHQPRDQIRVAFDDPRLAPDLYAGTLRVVDQEQVGFGIVGEIALRNVLPVAGEIDEGDRLVVEHTQETRWPATVLDIGLSVRAGGGEKDTRLRRDEDAQIGCDPGLPRAVLLHPPIGPARAFAGLHRFDRCREGDIARIGLWRCHALMLPGTLPYITPSIGFRHSVNRGASLPDNGRILWIDSKPCRRCWLRSKPAACHRRRASSGCRLRP